jgi:phosphonate transport system substrate-binding protein
MLALRLPTNLKRLALLGLAGCMIGSMGLSVPAAEPLALPDKIVVALKPDKNPDQMLAEKKSLEGFLSKQLGRKTEVIIPLSSAVILEGFANGTIDLGYLSATDLANGMSRGMASLLLAGEIKGKTSYESYWVVLKEKPYQSIEDLRGKPVAFAGKTSTSGHIIPLWDLYKKGFISGADAGEFFGHGNVWFGSGYVSAVERVLRGDAEAAAVSYYVLDEDKHLDLEKRGLLRKLASQGPVPTHVIAVRSSLSKEARDALRKELQKLNNPEHQPLRDRLFTSALVEVDADQHLAILREALDLVKSAK